MIRFQIKIVMFILLMMAFASKAEAIIIAGNIGYIEAENQGTVWQVQARRKRMSPRDAVRAVTRQSPRSRVLGVEYLKRRKGYSVRVRNRGGLRKVFIDARTGRIRRR